MLNAIVSKLFVDIETPASAKVKARPKADLSKLVVNAKEAGILLEILEEELSGKMYDRVFVMQSNFGRFNSWFWRNDVEWVFTWGEALRLRSYLIYKLNKGLTKELTIHIDALEKMPVYRKVN